MIVDQFSPTGNNMNAIPDHRQNKREQIAIDNFRAILSRIKETGRIPVYGAGSHQERVDFSFINSKRQAKSGRGKFKWYPLLDQMAADAGYPNIFNTIKTYKERRGLDRKGYAIKRCRQIIRKIKNRGHLERGTLTSGECAWLLKRSLAKHGHTKYCNRTITWYPELQEIAHKAGYPDLFDGMGGN
jgi:hypothetical protein